MEKDQNCDGTSYIHVKDFALAKTITQNMRVFMNNLREFSKSRNSFH